MDLLGQPRLNLDILRLTCNYLTDVPDVLSFALTCSALTEDAFRRRISMSPIKLADAESVHSFHTFIFSNELGRAPFIYGLELGGLLFEDVEEDDPKLQTVNNRLVAILQAASHIQYLRFPSDTTLDPVFAAAANATTLREVCMVFVSSMEPSWKLLPTFRSPLRSLRIDKNFKTCEYLYADILSDTMTTLAPTLEVLDLFELGLAADMLPSSVSTQFTAVRSLTIGEIFSFKGPEVQVLLRLFPNLSDTLTLVEMFTGAAGERDHATARERSKEAQQTNTNTWPRLDRLVCYPECAFLMALQCPIRRMDVTVPDNHGRRYLAPVLRDNCPRHLHLLCCAPFSNGLDDVDGLFPPPGFADPLTHLAMLADFHVPYGWNGKRNTTSWQQFMDKLVESVKHLSLTHLRLVLHFSVRTWRMPDGSVVDEDPLNIAGDSDIYPIALRLVDAIPSLQYVFLTACGNPYAPDTRSRNTPPDSGCATRTPKKWHASKSWRVGVHELLPENRQSSLASQPNAGLSDSRGQCAWVELSWAAAERVIAQEELHLDPRQEWTVKQCRD